MAQKRMDEPFGLYIAALRLKIQLRLTPEWHTLAPGGHGYGRVYTPQRLEHRQDLVVQNIQAVFQVLEHDEV